MESTAFGNLVAESTAQQVRIYKSDITGTYFMETHNVPIYNKADEDVFLALKSSTECVDRLIGKIPYRMLEEIVKQLSEANIREVSERWKTI